LRMARRAEPRRQTTIGWEATEKKVVKGYRHSMGFLAPA
jgi:hypothetical protein